MTPTGPIDVIRVLVVDDDPDDRLLARDLLEESGQAYEVVEADGFGSGLAELGTGRHEIALLDYRLGSRSGLDLLAEARKAGSHTPAILLTGVGDPDVDRLALEAGALDFLVKGRMDSTLLDRSIRYAVTTHRAMQELQDWKRRYNAAVRAARLVLVEWSPDLDRISVGANVPDLLGFPASYFADDAGNWAALVHPDDLPGLRVELERARSEGGRFRAEYRMRRKDGVLVHLLHEGELVGESGTERTLTGFASDVTEQRRIGHQLLQAQKMDAVGRLAGGIAHDFNTVLTSVLSYSDLASMGDDPGQIREDLCEIRRSAQRGAALTRRLLSFSRSDPGRPHWLDVSALVEDLARMLVRLIGSSVTIETDLVPSPPSIHADPGQVEQVLLNLALNARDSMPDGGRIRITTRVETGADAAAPNLVLAVEDEGVGMDETVRARLFEPFFTTKEPGRGTGLGLSIVHGIVKGLGGTVRVSSRPGEGSRFEVVLPAKAEPPASPIPESTPGALAKGSGTILVVDDDAALRELARRILAAAGYRVLVAGSAEDAVRVFGEGSDRIDLLLTDFVMPDASGPALVHRIRQKRPGLPVVFVSGLLDAGSRIADLPAVSLVAKPYLPAELTGAVLSLLEARPGPR